MQKLATERLQNLHRAAAILERDSSINGLEAASRLVGSEAAMGMLVAGSRVNFRGPSVEARVNNLLGQMSLLPEKVRRAS
jgi:hypothetical protein